jgi:hypothetical protein
MHKFSVNGNSSLHAIRKFLEENCGQSNLQQFFDIYGDNSCVIDRFDSITVYIVDDVIASLFSLRFGEEILLYNS